MLLIRIVIKAVYIVRRRTPLHRVRFDAKTYVRNDFKYLPDIVSDTRKPGFTTEVALEDFYAGK